MSRRDAALLLAVLMACWAGVAVAQLEYEWTRKSHDEDRCYDAQGNAQRCIPPFENAAYNVLIEATNTCGQNHQPTPFCRQISHEKRSCDICYEGDHEAYFLTDHETVENSTWWQSQTMNDGIQYPNQVNLTIYFNKTFDITYIRPVFESPRPESWAIYRRKSAQSDWEPYQFYSMTCRDTYGLPESKSAPREDETRALCTSEFSDIVPLTRGTVAFSTLEGRPSAYSFATNTELQDWVQAYAIRITLDRLNTFGDEVFGDEQVLQSYYYAIADIAVGARCACNGHAGECPSKTGVDGQIRRFCRCEHFTTGPDCNECLPFYNDAPWGRASTTDAHECKPCNCNGYSDRCYFDRELYEATGHGGHCVNCRDNRDGANCERCLQNFYARPEDGYCVPCYCNEIGSRSLQCNSEGKCQCKPGVTGDKCDRCDYNFFDFSNQGCTSCDCYEAGSLDNSPNCEPVTGVCNCKDHVEGKQCRKCRPGFFNLDLENEFGCTPCFCYGHSSVCTTATGYSRVSIESSFARGIEHWSAVIAGSPANLKYDSQSQSITVETSGRDNVYFVAPKKFIGDQRASYNQDLSFSLRISDHGAAPTASDIILEGGNGQRISQPIFGQGNRMPSTEQQEYTFRLHEHPDYGWSPHLSPKDFISILANLTAIKIRGTYTHQGKGYLDDVHLETAHLGAVGEPADWVEHCSCPTGYVGQFCESCAAGYHHDPPNGGPFALCVLCDCNGHADVCEGETGQCICGHNTAGNNCEYCARGFYGQPSKGTPYDCQPCPCPDNGSCILLGDNPDPICSECPVGRTGRRCEMCSDGYFGNPERGIPCKLCECNNNIDLNAVRNCHHETGECLKCVNNTAGYHCEECLSGYYGDALSDRKEEACKPCQCYPPGTQETENGMVAACDQFTGHCPCKSHVTGRNCDKCEDGFYYIQSGEGCMGCNCDLEGSYNRTCDAISGQCYCRPGITGQRCDGCVAYYYGFGREGCKYCDCDNIGSQEFQCDASGQCPCLPNVEGRRCDRCKENKHARQYGCVDCPPCYSLVQDAANEHRARLADLEETLRKIRANPTVVDEAEFRRKLAEVQANAAELLVLAKSSIGDGGKSLVDQLNDLSDQLSEIREPLMNVEETANDAKRMISQGKISIEEAENILDKIRDELAEIEDYFEETGQAALNEARRRADHVGHQNQQMTEIAHEARLVADANLNEARNLQVIAEQAKNTSLQAYNLAKRAIAKYMNVSDEVKLLENKLMDLEERYGDVKQRVYIAAEKADAVQAEALNLLILGITVPVVNVSDLQNRVYSVNKEAEQLRNNARNLLHANSDLVRDVQEKVRRSYELIARAEAQHSLTAELLAEVDNANVIATEAITRGEQTLKEAQDTLKKLSAFDAEVQRAREIAEAALQDNKKIYDTINIIMRDLDQLHPVLEASEMKASDALAAAQTARASASDASDVLNGVRKEVATARSDAIKLGSEAEQLHVRINATGAVIGQYENTVRKDAAAIAEAKQKVGQVKSNITSVSQQIFKALEEIAEITRELEALPDLSNDELDRLEERLQQAERDIRTANLEQRIRTLAESKNLQSQWVRNYEDEVNRLRAEVDNINEIKKVLPEGCYKKPRLEP